MKVTKQQVLENLFQEFSDVISTSGTYCNFDEKVVDRLAEELAGFINRELPHAGPKGWVFDLGDVIVEVKPK